MGTRNSTLVKINHEYVVAQYGQWDGYPEGQGKTILETLLSCDLQELREKCYLVKQINEQKMKNIYEQAKWETKDKSEGSFMSMETANLIKSMYPQLSRDCGGEILREILNGAREINRDVDFAMNDSTFCEWSYVVDFDEEKFEVYKGTARPDNLLVSYDLNSLPTVEQFLQTCEELSGVED